jgi:hypothetical protein
VFFANVIGKLFFAASLPDWVRQTQTFGIFAAGYLVRPIGGIVMAHCGVLPHFRCNQKQKYPSINTLYDLGNQTFGFCRKASKLLTGNG